MPKTRNLKKRRTRKHKKPHITQIENSPESPSIIYPMVNLYESPLSDSSDFLDLTSDVQNSPESPSIIYPMVNLYESPLSDSSDFLDLTVDQKKRFRNTFKNRHQKKSKKRKSLRDFIENRKQNPIYIKNKQETFVRLANEHFMDSNLEMVIRKYHFSKGNVNIFIIGEQHAPRNYTGIGIYEAFKNFYDAVQINTIPVDILVEISDDVYDYGKLPYDIKRLQMINVRGFFHDCIFKHNCGNVKVHWLDGDYSQKNEMIYRIPLSEATETKTRTTLSEMPQWLRTFQQNYIKVKSNGNLMIDPTVEKIIEKKGIESFLTENTIVMKELSKATQINSEFNLPFAIKFLNHVHATKKRLFNIYRAIMDIYTVARIIKNNMINVIIYHGAVHAENVAMMLSQLSYTLNREFPSESERAEQLRLSIKTPVHSITGFP